MHIRQFTAALAVAALALTLTACSQSSGGSAGTNPTSANEVGQQTPSGPMKEVKMSDLTICTVFKAEDLKAIVSEDISPEPAGPICTLGTKGKQMLALTIAQSHFNAEVAGLGSGKQGWIDGNQAVLHQATASDNESCKFVVKLHSRTTFNVDPEDAMVVEAATYAPGKGVKVCDLASKMATMVLGKLPAA
ncbi:DUF3558 family protein [Solihabitans fulvus]|nr:DUF3558 family protein [Solihabitans fulvus]